MKKALAIPLFLTAWCLVISATPLFADTSTFEGTPSPALDPTFGTLVNFDDQATGTAVGSADYVFVGVTSIAETEGLGFFGRYGGSQSSPNYIGTGLGGDRGDNGLGWDGTIVIDLLCPANKIGLGFANGVAGSETLTIYDAYGAVLGSAGVPAGGNTYFGFDSTTFDIMTIEATGDFFAIDDLQFNSPSFAGGACVMIDIKPGSFPNSINPNNKGVIPVAILGSELFDVASIDVTTLMFGPSDAAPAHTAGGHFEDVNGDGFLDLVSHYWTAETGIAVGDSSACVTGELFDGSLFVACDSVRMVPPGAPGS